MAEIAKFTRVEREQYEASLKYYRDLENVIDTSFQEGKLEGKLEGLMEGKLEGLVEGKVQREREIAINALSSGLSIAVIIQLTGLSEEEIINIAHQSNNE